MRNLDTIHTNVHAVFIKYQYIGNSRINRHYLAKNHTLSKAKVNEIECLQDLDFGFLPSWKGAFERMFISHFLIETAKHAWIVWRDSAIESTSCEMWNGLVQTTFEAFS